jgi:hypothetical protein
MPTAGSILELKINQRSYNVVGEAELTVKSPTDLTSTPTTGASIVSVKKQNPDVEGVQIDGTDPEDRETLEELSRTATAVSVSFTEASGVVNRSTSCIIGVMDYNTQSGILELVLMPNGKWLRSI